MSEAILQIISKRRSCRSFTTEQLSQQDIELLIQAGQGAPIGMNFIHTIQLFVIQNKELLNELEQNTLNYFSTSENQIANHKINNTTASCAASAMFWAYFSMSYIPKYRFSRKRSMLV